METILPVEYAVTCNLGPIQRIPPGEGRVFRIGEIDVAVFRTRADGIFATQARCPHRGGPLADGLLGAGKVVCPLHAFVFDLASGQSLDNACAWLRTYPVTLNADDEIVLTLTGAEPLTA